MSVLFGGYGDPLSQVWDCAHLLRDDTRALVDRARLGDLDPQDELVLVDLRARHHHWTLQLENCAEEFPAEAEALHTTRLQLDAVAGDLVELAYWQAT